MRMFNTELTWGVPQRLLHWIMAGLIFFMLGFGFYMAYAVEDPLQQFALVQIHKSWGFVAFALVGLRLIWRAMNRVHPALPDHMSRLEKTCANLGHLGLYALMFIMPISGWLMSSASTLQELFGIRNEVFGLFELPDPFQPGSESLEAVFSTIHFLGAWALIAVVLGHAGAAMWHHFIKHDTILRRMTWGA